MINRLTDDDLACLSWVCYYNNYELAKLLIEFKISKNIINLLKNECLHFLNWACRKNNYELAELIRESFFRHGHDSWVSIANDIIDKIKVQ